LKDLLARHLRAEAKMKTTAAALFLSAFAGQAQTMVLNSLLPFAAVPGQTTKVQWMGNNPGGPTRLWTSCRTETTRLDGEAASFNVTVPAHTPAGIGAIRVLTTNGASNLSLFMLDPLASVAQEPGNNSMGAARRIHPPVAVDGFCHELRSDFYKFSARKGQQLSIEVVAQRLGSFLDPRVRMLDAVGRELVAVEDTPGLGADCALTFKVPKSSDYLLEIRDTKYEGGQKHRYRLRVGEFSLTRLPFLSDAIPRELLEMSASNPKQMDECEPNSQPREAQRVTVPVLISGGFAKPGDRDLYQFEVNEGQRLLVRGRTRSLGFACDLFLQIQDTNGNKVAEANVTGADEGTLTNTFRKAGTYRFLVEELNQQGGPGLDYQVELRTLVPGFALSTDSEAVSAPPGGSFELAVRPRRRDYEGPITLSIVGLDPRFSITNNVITARTNETIVRVTVPSDIEVGDFRQFVIVGRAEIEGGVFEARTSTLPALRKMFPEMPFPPDALDGLIAFGASAKPQ
jgi:hypothetical protein